MIDVSIAYGYSNENKYKLENIPESIQLSIFKYDLYKTLKEKIYNDVENNNTVVKVIHLPLDTLKQEPSNIIYMMEDLKDNLSCGKFIIHPNKLIKSFLDYFAKQQLWDMELCIENFSWRRKKELRNPLKVLEFINDLRNIYDYVDNIRLCFDTSHADNVLFDHQLLHHLLPYTSVIHLSNTEGRKQHLPFNIGKGDLNLIGFVKELKKRYKWNGIIVLEYMEEYHYKLIPNSKYLRKLLYG